MDIEKAFEEYLEVDIEFPQMELPEESELDEAKLKKGDVAQAILCRTQLPWGEENGSCKQ